VKTRAAVLWGPNQRWEVDEVELDGPKANEVMIRLAACGLCHSDYHLVTGDVPAPMPFLAGHEGAGVVVEVGPGVTDIAEGDHVVISFVPACGRCVPCAQGMSNLCDLGRHAVSGPQPDGTYRFHARGKGVGQYLLVGAFAEYTVAPTASVIKIDPAIPLASAALLGCGVTTGYGSVVRTGEARPGDTVVVMGIGGVGINAVQGARIAGARHIVAVDPVEFKRDRAREFGATHVAASIDEALPLVRELTRGAKAELCVITTDVGRGSYVAPALSLVGKRGRVVQTAMGSAADKTVDLSLFELTLFEKQLRGSLFGSSNPRSDIPDLLALYESGALKLDELITREYALEDINTGFDDMLSGRNLRGLIRY